MLVKRTYCCIEMKPLQLHSSLHLGMVNQKRKWHVHQYIFEPFLQYIQLLMLD